MVNEHIWVWLRTNGKIYKIISDLERGIIEVINVKGEILIRKTNLSKRQVETLEKNFLKHNAKRLNGRETVRNSKDTFDPMIA